MSVTQENVLDDADKGVLADAALENDADNDFADGGGEPQIDYEKEALENGWNPDYNGPNKKTAKQFVEDGQAILPIVQANSRKHKERADALEAELRETKANTQKSIQALEKQFKRETDRKLAELREEKLKAVGNADKEAFERLEKEEKDLLKPAEPEPEKTTPDYKSDPVIQAWESENPWYGTDKDLTDYADWYAEKRVSGTGKKGKEYLDTVAEGVKKQFPHKFKNPRKDNHTGAAPSSRQQPGKTTSFDTLPASAKRDFDYAVTRGLVKDTAENRQQFAKDFAEAE